MQAWRLRGDRLYAAILFGVYELTREAPFVCYAPQN
jgi:hypothetical protein